MKLNTDFGLIDIVNERAYTFGSADNVRTYVFEKNLSKEARPTSIHGIILDTKPLAVFGAGGASGVHDRSAILVKDRLYLAVGDQVVCISPKPFQFNWAVQTDPAACFGVYFEPKHTALISHGELEISRFSEHGKILWSVSGADIFSEGFELLPICIKAIDFNGQIYCFSYENGKDIV
jgi:hypothetical protein